MVLETERTILRPFRESDARDMFAYAGDPRVGPAAGWRPHACVEDSRRAIRGVLSRMFAVADRASGRVIGSAGFVEKCPGCRSNELGFALHPDWWGRGIAPEVCGRLVRYGFEELGFSEIWGICRADNARCRRVLEKCAFQPVFEQALLDGAGQEQTMRFYVLLRQEGKEAAHGR